MNNIFKYIGLGIGVVESVTAFIALLAPKKPVTGPQVAGAAEPAIDAIESAFNITIPPELIADVSNAAATAIDKYVFKA